MNKEEMNKVKDRLRKIDENLISIASMLFSGDIDNDKLDKIIKEDE